MRHIPEFSIADYCVLVQAEHYCEEVEHYPLYAIVWGAMNSEHLFEPYFLMDLSISLITFTCLKIDSYHNCKALGLKAMFGCNKIVRQLIVQ